jgi:hypothetical protein
MAGNAIKANSQKVRGFLLFLIEQCIQLTKPLMRLIEQEFAALIGTKLRDK